VRVTFSDAGVIADDVIRHEVALLNHDVPVLVVTNDQAVLADVRSLGANTLSSEQFLLVARR
jgi:predicted RNA-binding protein with PIN domain